MPRGEHRTVTPALQVFRNFLRGRPLIEALRYSDEIAARTQPPPKVPGGPYHKSSKVYYYTRDARRLVQPPIVIAPGKQIGAGNAPAAPEAKSLTPGPAYIPDK